MLAGKDKYEYFENIKQLLVPKGFAVSDVKEINYGLQFLIINGNQNGLVRIYESKKGIRYDLSQVKDSEFLCRIETFLNQGTTDLRSKTPVKNASGSAVMALPDDLIGTDESGKGDYFGPLVIAGVLVTKETSTILKELGIMDSKKMKDKTILELAPKIKQLCPHSIVPIGNQKYNELYDKIQNLNRLLAWGHARVIENILTKQECNTVLSDQFGDEKLIQKALLEKGKTITLHQMPRAEENIAVAAASVLARNEYVTRLEQMSSSFRIKFPKGASATTKESAKRFVSQYGSKELKNVAKLHFKTTQQIME
ncbi:ribonuclease HIII [Neobacillus sp. NPDC093127]|uniref:ribonuclease HIII n=1 Tax=Neobacillus sp. NPDC093127 TaxID=3364296 RepID=UPI003825DD76